MRIEAEGIRAAGQLLFDGDAVAESGTQHQLQWDFNISAAELLAGGGEVTIDFTWSQRNFLELVTTQSGDSANATQSFTISVSGPEDFEEEIFDLSENISAGQSPSSESFGTKDFFEGISSFAEGRDPDFSGR